MGAPLHGSVHVHIWMGLEWHRLRRLPLGAVPAGAQPSVVHRVRNAFLCTWRVCERGVGTLFCPHRPW